MPPGRPADVAAGGPAEGPPSARVKCPTCDASIGQHCQRWKISHGQRLYRIGQLSKQHAARTAAARAAGHQLPTGRPR